MARTKSYDFLNRLGSISSVPSVSSCLSFDYSYNSANQRTTCRLADNTLWQYQYDSLGQLTSAKKYWPDWTPVAGQQFEYRFDDIGNRTQTKSGGDENGWNLRQANYGANSLNQYTNRDVPPYVDIMGVAYATSSVTVNALAAYRHGEYFRKELPVTNSTVALWTNITVAATGQTSVSGNLFVPKTPEAFGYDADGNMTNDGRFTMTWDAENRLVQLESLSTSPTASNRKVFWEFDAKGRRIRQTTYDGSTGSYVATEDLKLLSDGWRNIAELSATNNALIRSYVWGLDLSGSLDGAGGIGGLLMMSSAASGAHFYASDGNGNTAGLTSAGDGTATALYEYEPFGKPLRTTGPISPECPFRFSTKRASQTADLSLYDRRPYSPSLGRFGSRDLVEDEAFSTLADADVGEDVDGNPNHFAGNDPVNKFDPVGLWPSSSPFIGVALGGIPWTHQNANRRELRLSEGDLFVVNYATVAVDERQEPELSYMHAMRNGWPLQSPQSDTEARRLANNFVRDNLLEAQSRLCDCTPENYLHALEFFGYALHTVQDSTSPSHNHARGTPGHHEFRRWFGEWDLPNAAVHVVRENFDPDYPGSGLDTATREFKKYFRCKSSAPPFPTDFFTYGVDTSRHHYE